MKESNRSKEPEEKAMKKKKKKKRKLLGKHKTKKRKTSAENDVKIEKEQENNFEYTIPSDHFYYQDGFEDFADYRVYEEEEDHL